MGEKLEGGFVCVCLYIVRLEIPAVWARRVPLAERIERAQFCWFGLSMEMDGDENEDAWKDM